MSLESSEGTVMSNVDHRDPITKIEILEILEILEIFFTHRERCLLCMCIPCRYQKDLSMGDKEFLANCVLHFYLKC